MTAVALVSFFGAVASAQPKGSIDGQIQDTVSKEPLMGVRITLAGTNKRAVTDHRGSFMIDDVGPGSYQLWLVGTGYLPVMRKVDLAAGEMFHLTVELQPEGEVRVEQPPVTSAPVGNERMKVTLLGGLGYMFVGDYNKHVDTQRKLAQNRYSGENLIFSGELFHRSASVDFEARYSLSRNLAVGIGVGRITASDGYNSQTGSDYYVYRHERKLSTQAFPVGLSAYAVYPVQAHTFYLGFGLSRIFADIDVEDANFRNALSTEADLPDSSWTANTKLSSSGWGSNLRGGFEVKLSKHLSVTGDALLRWAPVSGFTGTRTRQGDGAAVEDDVKMIFRTAANSAIGTANYLEIVQASAAPSYEATTRSGQMDYSGFYFTLGVSFNF
jgi:hypothetical protein